MAKKAHKDIKKNNKKADEVVLSEGDKGYAVYLGNKIVELISMLDMDDEMKKNMFIIAGSMDLEALEDFVSMLEDKYVEDMAKPVAEEYDAEIERVEKKYNQKRIKLIHGAVDDFDEIVQKAKMMAARSRVN